MTILQPEYTFDTLMEMTQLERVWFSYGVLTADEQAKLQEANPNIVYHGVYIWDQSNEDPCGTIRIITICVTRSDICSI